MSPRGLQNARRRLEGARRLGSTYLTHQAEEEGRHALEQARAWLAPRQGTAPAINADGALVQAMAQAAEGLAALLTP